MKSLLPAGSEEAVRQSLEGLRDQVVRTRSQRSISNLSFLRNVRGVVQNTFSDLCRAKIEKEKREHARQHGMIRTEFSGGEIAEEMEKERRLFQLQMCEVSRVP